MGRTCGGCNFQGGSKSDKQGARIFCLYDNQWHKDIDICTQWIENVYNMGKEERLKMASDLRNRMEAKKSNRKDKIFHIFLVLLGALATLFVQWINSLWNK